MNRHPGGEEQTIHLLKSIELKKGMKALDLEQERERPCGS